MIIYKATNKTNGKIYVGQTVGTLKNRNRLRKYGKTIFDNAFKKYGEDGFDWLIIDTANNINCLNKKESYWIEKLDSTNKEIGYNLIGGGANAWKTDYVKEKIGRAQRGELNHMYGVKYGDNKTSKRVIDIKTGVVYESLTYIRDTIFKELETDCVSCISSSCRGESSSYRGFYFRFIDDEDVISYTRFDNDDYSIKHRGKDCIMLFNLEGDTYEASEIASEYGISREKLLCNSYHYNSKLLKFQIPYVKTKDIWVTEDVYNTFKENFDKYDFEKHRTRTSRIKNTYDGLVFNGAVEASEYYVSNGFRLSKGAIWNHLREKSVLKYTKEFVFVYVD